MGLTFLFSGALLALPLAGLPVLLHLLYQKKSPVVFFSTIRFIKASVQRTAARKRVQKWLLLAVRVILLAILIAAVAQPAKLLSGGWAAPGKSSIAAIVVDTSYSMQLLDHHEPLLAKADTAVRELLGSQLANTKVAIFRSPNLPPGQTEQLHAAGEILAEWAPLAPQANPRPLVDRVAAAADLLERQHAEDKWLVVISDFQRHEFPGEMTQPKGVHLVMIDLHPDDPRNAGVSKVSIDPAQPTVGIGSEAVVDVTGRPNTSRAVSVSIASVADKKLLDGGVQVANLDAAGHSRLRVPLHLPAQRWMMLKASFQDDDDMAWDNTRSQLIETPPQQSVTFLGNPAAGNMQRAVWLALDPSEGTHPDGWSLKVKQGKDISPDASAAVMLADEWPDAAHVARLISFVRGGGTLVLFLRPGLEETWPKLPDNQKAALKSILPSEPIVVNVALYSSVAVAAQQDPLLAGFADERFQIHSMVVRRIVPFSGDPQATLLLNCFPRDPGPGLHSQGLLYRKPVGAGQVYTVATLPGGDYSNIATHPLFLPLMVRMCQRSAGRGDAQNIELGQSLTLIGRQFEAFDSMTLQGPAGDTTIVKASHAGGVTQFPFGAANAPGLYSWLKPGGAEPMAITNVQLPSNESELFYSPPPSLVEPGDNVMIARSVAELHTKVANLGEPEPKWTMPIAIVLLMLCVEALMASLSRIWKPISLRGVLAGA
ncbi:MAG TPA: BatA domain-containing protein [Tepidisphaeraceae bacterium]|jgi:hypothetical protein|nr:BatA domain-containing protein [Tepidisphaeraceae bacterium]